MGFRKSISKREVYRNTIMPQEIRKASNRQPNPTSKPAGKRKQNPQSQQKERNHKDQSRYKWKTNERNNSKD